MSVSQIPHNPGREDELVDTAKRSDLQTTPPADSLKEEATSSPASAGNLDQGTSPAAPDFAERWTGGRHTPPDLGDLTRPPTPSGPPTPPGAVKEGTVGTEGTPGPGEVKEATEFTTKPGEIKEATEEPTEKGELISAPVECPSNGKIFKLDFS